MAKICVVGSINMDLVVTSERRPCRGETLLGKAFFTNPGGKGANQAVAAARLGADVTMLGCVGNDIYGEILIQKLKEENINVQYIKRSSKSCSGVANIIIAENDNSIIVVPGANYEVDRSYIDDTARIIKTSDMVLTQLEIPLDTVIHLSELCRRQNIPLLLNPAPAVTLPQTLVDNATYITPNEYEAKTIFPGEKSLEELMLIYPNKLIITLGEKGAAFFDGQKRVNIPSMRMEVVDTTGAGDTFNGGFACGICNGLETERAIAFANAAAGLSITKLGAQSGMPVLSEVIKKLV